MRYLEHMGGWSGCACKDCDHPPSLGGEKPLREEDREEKEPNRQSWPSHPVEEKDLDNCTLSLPSNFSSVRGNGR